MADEYLHGVRVIEVMDGTRPIKSISTGVIGLVCTADDANNDFFPLNKAVLITNVQNTIGKAGTTGTLRRALTAIADIVNTPTVVVRVADVKGDTPKDQQQLTANIIGTVTGENKYTGLQALLVAKTTLGIKPRILAVPKHDKLDVAIALAAVAKKLNAFAYVTTHECKTISDAVKYRKKFSQRELLLIHGNFTSFDTNTSKHELDYAVARACAVRAYIDKEIGWHKVLSNVAVQGVSGVEIPLYFDIQDSACDTNFLNKNDVTACINHNGFRFWGSRTCTDDPLFLFENYTRTSQIVRDTIGEAFDWAIDKPLSRMLVKDIIEMINAKFSDWRTQGYIVDGKAWIDPELNQKETLKAGQLRISYDICPVPPLENLTFYQHINDEYLMDFASRVMQ